jgi:hypothetical protein
VPPYFLEHVLRPVLLPFLAPDVELEPADELSEPELDSRFQVAFIILVAE